MQVLSLIFMFMSTLRAGQSEFGGSFEVRARRDYEEPHAKWILTNDHCRLHLLWPKRSFSH